MENFNLKLRIFFLEERLALGQEKSSDKLLASNIDLKVMKKSLVNPLHISQQFLIKYLSQYFE